MSKFGGKSAGKLVTQGANPATLYGAAVTGVTELQLNQIRRTAACATPPYASRLRPASKKLAVKHLDDSDLRRRDSS